MQQIYSVTPIPKCDFNKVAEQKTFKSPTFFVIRIVHKISDTSKKKNTEIIVLQIKS